MLLLLMAAAASLSSSAWQALIDNFSIHNAGFTGREIGILQSLREVPGFLAFTVVWLLLLLREQQFALASLALLGIGAAITGLFPSVIGLYCTTVLMSIGFHYYYTLETSLSLQWIDKKRTPMVLGRLLSAASFASIIAFLFIWLSFNLLGLPYLWVYLMLGSITLGVALFSWFAYPSFPQLAEQHKKMILRKRYWLFYALEFLSGARRQIFVVFAGFLLAQRFAYGPGEIAILFLINATINMLIAPSIGRLIGQIGEKMALIIEYLALIAIFIGYALVTNSTVAAVLYVLDHMFFAVAIGIRTYLQKIADPADIASTAGISFTINHIAAIVLPAILGIYVWSESPSSVFLLGAVIALISLALAFLIPRHPAPGNETLLSKGWYQTAAKRSTP